MAGRGAFRWGFGFQKFPKSQDPAAGEVSGVSDDRWRLGAGKEREPGHCNRPQPGGRVGPAAGMRELIAGAAAARGAHSLQPPFPSLLVAGVWLWMEA